MIEAKTKRQVFADFSKVARGYVNGDVKTAISMGFYFPTGRLFGLGEREDTLMLKNTGDKPYELFATDEPNH